MKSVIPIIVLAALFVTGFRFSPDAGVKEAPEDECAGEAEEEEALSGMDMTETMMDGYLNGTMKAMYWVQTHDDVQAGQYWTTSFKMAGVGTTTNRWQVASVDGDTAIIEHRNRMVGEYSSYDYVIAYEIDLTPGEDDDEEAPEGAPEDEEGKTVEEGEDKMGLPNVNQAWIGRPGKKPQKIEVMDVPDGGGADTGPGADVEVDETRFENVAMAGGTWSGTRRVVSYNGSKTEVWIADNGWFGGMIRMKTASFVQELTKFGTDGKPILVWPEEEEDEEAVGEEKEAAEEEAGQD